MTSHICEAISLVGASITVCNPFSRSNFSSVITVNTAVFPVPDFASSNRSAPENRNKLYINIFLGKDVGSQNSSKNWNFNAIPYQIHIFLMECRGVEPVKVYKNQIFLVPVMYSMREALYQKLHFEQSLHHKFYSLRQCCGLVP